MTAQQLRESILQEAIQGKLVLQDLKDEPASVLLENIKKKKDRLIKEGEIRKSEASTNAVSEEEKFMSIPNGWSWVRLGEIAAYRKGPFGSSLTKSMFVPKSSSSYKVYEQKNAIKKNINIGDYYVTKEKYESMRGFWVSPGDIIVSCAGTIGETYLIPQCAPCGIINQALMRVRLYEPQMVDYWMLIFDYIVASNSTLKGKGSAIKNIPPFEILKNLPIPLPPLAEQKRIVAKVEELLPLVEKYNKAQTELDELNAKLPIVLRQSILQEAIQGHLLPQNPNDSSVNELLERILKAKQQSQTVSKTSKNKKNDVPKEFDASFEIPSNWAWMRLGDFLYTQTGLSYAKGDLDKKVENPVRVLRGGNILSGSWQMRDDDVMIAPEYVKTNLYLQKNIFLTPAVTSLEHLGKTAWIKENFNNVVAGGFVLYLIPYDRNEDTVIEYLSYFFQSPFYNSFCKSITNKSGQAFWNLSRQKLLDLRLPLPPLEEQRRIVEKIKELFAKTDLL